jgi:hypothetical protein
MVAMPARSSGPKTPSRSISFTMVVSGFSGFAFHRCSSASSVSPEIDVDFNFLLVMDYRINLAGVSKE